MIHKFLDMVVDLLRAGLAGAIPNPATQIMQGPPPDTPRPFIAVYSGDLHVGDQATDFSSSKPRPMELSEVFPVLTDTPRGPYPLSKTPLEGTALGKLVYAMGSLNEHRSLMAEKKDFTIDYANHQLNLMTDMAGVSHIQLTYSFAAIFFLQDFQQEFFIEMPGTDSAVLEQLASLASSIMFTQQDELINGYNLTDRTVYSVNQYLSEHWIGRFAWLDSITAYNGTNIDVKMRFSVNGQIKHVREDVSGFGLIEKIHSPGTPAATGVEIKPELG